MAAQLSLSVDIIIDEKRAVLDTYVMDFREVLLVFNQLREFNLMLLSKSKITS